jgi:hypothetical protein
MMAGVMATFAWMPRAHACTCTIDGIWDADPKDNSTGVALNRALVVQGVFKSGTAKLEDAQGVPVEVTVREGPVATCPGTSAELVPKAALKPNARYVIRVEALYPGAESTSISFTTGTERLPERTLDAPRAQASVLRDAPEAMCGPGGRVFLCLGSDGKKDLELIVRKGDKILLRAVPPHISNDASYVFVDEPDCIELRRTAPNGQRSEPTTICGAALKARAWREDDSKQGVVPCRDGVIGAGEVEPIADQDAGVTELSGRAGAPAIAGATALAAAGASAGATGAAGSGGAKAPTAPTPAQQKPPASDSGCAVSAAPVSGSDAVPAAFSLLLSLAFRRRAARWCSIY